MLYRDPTLSDRFTEGYSTLQRAGVRSAIARRSDSADEMVFVAAPSLAAASRRSKRVAPFDV